MGTGIRAGITALDAFQYHRFRSALRVLLGSDMCEPVAMPSLTYLLQTQSPRHGITMLYSLFLDNREGTNKNSS